MGLYVFVCISVGVECLYTQTHRYCPITNFSISKMNR